jgi:hypothetical protein
VEGSEGILKNIALFQERMAALDEEIQRINELAAEREALRQAIWALENVIGKTPADEVQMPIWQHTQSILSSNGNKPMNIAEITDALAARRVKLESKTPSESVRTTLIRKPDIFERVEGGKFKLKQDLPQGPYMTAGQMFAQALGITNAEIDEVARRQSQTAADFFKQLKPPKGDKK